MGSVGEQNDMRILDGSRYGRMFVMVDVSKCGVLILKSIVLHA